MEKCADNSEYIELLKDSIQPSDYEKLLCPEKKAYDDLAKMEGFYRSKGDRVSIQVIMAPCYDIFFDGRCFNKERV
jgi:hypothetical protein